MGSEAVEVAETRPEVRVSVDRRVRFGAWLLVVVAVGAAVGAWIALLVAPPELDRDDAARVAREALADAGLEAGIDGRVTAVAHVDDQDRTIDAWSVPVGIDGEQIEVRVRMSSGQLVYVDDRIGPDDAEQLLTDRQFETLSRYRDDRLRREAVRRDAVGSVAAALIVVVAVVIARLPTTDRS